MRITAKEAKRLTMSHSANELDFICVTICAMATSGKDFALFDTISKESKEWLKLNSFEVEYGVNKYCVSWNNAQI